MFKQHAKKTKRVPFVAALATLGLTIAAITVTASPAVAADTTATFTLAGGQLAITASPSATLDTAGLQLTGANSGAATGQIADVTVTDARSALTGSWEAVVQSTDFVPNVAADAIPATSVQYWSGPQTNLAVALVVPGQLTVVNAATLGGTSPVPAFEKTGGIGSSTVTWSPTVIVNIPPDAVAATYTGTVTHSLL